METIQSRSDLQQLLSLWRGAGDRVAIVPTMGSLHDGHLSLVRIARAHADRVVVTLFVNPTQFAAGEDYATYPRMLEKDTARLREEKVDLLFAPEIETLYPFGLEAATRVSVPELADDFCGAGRPGHFDGVTSVVLRLFALLQPDIAIFGQKDFQQQLIIRRMVTDIGLPIEIIVGPVIREANGLAMSSRNAHFSEEQREIAAVLYRILQDAADELSAGKRDFAKLETKSVGRLQDAQQVPEYFAIRQAVDLSVPDPQCLEFVVLAASRVGTVRLIDNVVVVTR